MISGDKGHAEAKTEGGHQNLLVFLKSEDFEI